MIDTAEVNWVPRAGGTRRIPRLIAGAIIALSALALSGCTGGGTEPEPRTPEATPPPAPRVAVLPDAEQADAEGRQEVPLGDAAVVVDEAGEQIGSVTLLQVERNFQCDSSIDEPAKNGGFIGLRFEVATPSADEGSSPLRLSAHHLWGYGADGAFIPDIFGVGYLCADDAIGPNFLPDETRTGWIVLDAPEGISFVTYDSDPRHDLTWKWRLDD